MTPSAPSVVDLFSDTHTVPDAGMRRAVAEAEVGDEQLGEDPTTAALEARVAEVLGTEAAVFLPTGSMCNKIGVAAFTRPGDAVVVDARAHVLRFEGGGPAVLSGVVFEPIVTDRGHFTPEQLAAVASPGSVYQPRTSLVCLEQTHNFAGGTVWPFDRYRAVCDAARRIGASLFTDGARLLNAVAATGIAPNEWSDPVDAVWIDFSKGLGAPGGAAFAGSAVVVERAVRFKYLFGGAMRQSGMLAAAALYGLDHNAGRLGDDHRRAARLADGLAGVGLDVQRPETNMVFFDAAPAGFSATGFAAALAERGVRTSVVAGRIRAVTHLGVDDAAIDLVIEAAGDAVTAGPGPQ